MRDLYSDLRIDPSLSSTQIEQMFLNTDRGRGPAVASALAILLKANRRSQYDRVHAAVSHIAALRGHLDLGSTEFARQHEASFTVAQARAQRSNAAGSAGAARSAETQRKQKTVHIAPTKPSGIFAKILWLFRAASVVGLIIFLGGLLYLVNENDQARRGTDTTRSPTATSSPRAAAPEPPPLPLPATGAFDTSTSSTSTAIIIKTRAGGGHTLVKIRNVGGAEVTRGFIRGGDQHTFRLPLGTYLITMASGDNWYGEQLLFGRNTSYSKADDTFPLLQRGEQWTVELIPQTNGNLQERPISAGEF